MEEQEELALKELVRNLAEMALSFAWLGRKSLPVRACLSRIAELTGQTVDEIADKLEIT